MWKIELETRPLEGSFPMHWAEIIVSDFTREGLNNPHLGRNAIGCGSKIRFEDLSER